MSENPYEPTTPAIAVERPRLPLSSWIATVVGLAVWLILLFLIYVYGKPEAANGNLNLQYDGPVPFSVKDDPYTFSVMFIETSVLAATLIACGFLVAILTASHLIAYCWRRVRLRWGYH